MSSDVAIIRELQIAHTNLHTQPLTEGNRFEQITGQLNRLAGSINRSNGLQRTQFVSLVNRVVEFAGAHYNEVNEGSRNHAAPWLRRRIIQLCQDGNQGELDRIARSGGAAQDFANALKGEIWESTQKHGEDVYHNPSAHGESLESLAQIFSQADGLYQIFNAYADMRARNEGQSHPQTNAQPSPQQPQVQHEGNDEDAQLQAALLASMQTGQGSDMTEEEQLRLALQMSREQPQPMHHAAAAAAASSSHDEKDAVIASLREELTALQRENTVSLRTAQDAAYNASLVQDQRKLIEAQEQQIRSLEGTLGRIREATVPRADFLAAEARIARLEEDAHPIDAMVLKRFLGSIGRLQNPSDEQLQEALANARRQEHVAASRLRTQTRHNAASTSSDLAATTNT